MALARVDTFALDGVEARRVWVEADIRCGLPAFSIVGLADKAVREARERVRAAVTNSGYVFPGERITINLAPAYLRKVGAAFDLPVAVALLAASGQIPREAVAGCAVVGELSLYGEVRPMRGALAMAESARRSGSRPAGAAAAPRGGGGARPRAGDPRASRRSRRRSRCWPGSAPRRPSPPSRRPPSPSARSPTWPTSAATTRSSRRSRSPRRAGTTSSSTARPGPARRCSRGGCRRCCRR